MDQHPPHDAKNGDYLVASIYEALRNGPKVSQYTGRTTQKFLFTNIIYFPTQWNSTLFLVTYDEHGGFYDHVPTPLGVPPPDDHVCDFVQRTFLCQDLILILFRFLQTEKFSFDRLGVRVPTVVVSPWINKGKGLLFLCCFYELLIHNPGLMTRYCGSRSRASSI